MRAAGGRELATRVLIVASRFNEGVTRALLDGAKSVLREHGLDGDQVDVVWVPGAFELPVAVGQGLQSGRYGLAIALGAVIRGETPHFEYVCQAATRGLMDVSLRHGRAVGFGLLTCDTEEQAFARAGGPAGNKGAEAARAALETARALADLGERA